MAKTQAAMVKSLAKLKNGMEALARQMNQQMANLIQQLNRPLEAKRSTNLGAKGPAEPTPQNSGSLKVGNGANSSVQTDRGNYGMKS